MKSRSRKRGGGDDGPKNAIELGSIPPPAPAPRTGFKALTPRPKGWSKASEALDRIRAISTLLVDFNRATRVGGLPLRRIATIHGPTHGGKTAFLAALIRSFLDAGHIAGYVDAEHATDLTWLDELLEAPADDFENFWGMRPTSYEETIDSSDEFLAWMIEERRGRFGKYGKAPIPPEENLAGLLVIDSLNKLVPKREMEKLRKEGGEALDKGWGRLRAAFNQAFLDHIVPLLGKAETSLAVIVQERGDDEDLKPWEMPKLKGGQASQYDASLIIRIMKSIEVARGEGKEKQVFGFKHRMRIWKSKVGHMDGRWSDAHFHMSNGALVRPGFDTARDAVMLGKELGIIEGAGWMTWRKNRWNGDHSAVVALTKDREKLHALLAQINDRIRKDMEAR